MKYLFKFILIVVILLGGASTMHLFAQTYTFTASGNTVSFPVGTSLKIEVWGAGGRGGSNTTGGGGGGGAYASSTITVTQATAYYVNVGTGSTSTAAGGDSWFAPNNNVNNALVLAKGGNSATNSNGATGGSYSASIGQVRNNGGRGANATSDGGGGGSSAGATGLGVNATNQFGAVGPTGNDGIGGNGRASSNGAGTAATIGPGGGGGGARGNNAGGAGANGRVIITVLGPQSEITNTSAVQEWIAPEDVTSIEVETWGGGGRGGSRTTGNNNTGFGGGGGGGYSRSLLSVSSGTTYYVNVGAGSASTTVGEDSWFSSTNVTTNSLVRAKGGNSVSNNTTTGAAGGAASGGTDPARGDVRLAGGSGSNGGVNSNGGTGGASPNGGTGGAGKQSNSTGNGASGNPPGGGGGGAYRTIFGGSPSGGNGANGKVTIHTFYNLSIAKTVTTTTPLVGTNVTFTLTVTNNGTNTAKGIVVTDAFPTGITYVSNSTSATFNAGTLTWNVGTLNPAASASINIVATVNASGNYANTANLTANLANNGNSSSIITLFPQKPTADLQLTKEVNNTMPTINGQVTFTLTAYNAGPQNATNVKVQDILPFGFTYVSSSAGYDNNTGIWTIGTLNKAASQVLTLTASVNAFGNYYNQAVVSANEVDPNQTNNTSGISVYPIYPIIEVVLPCATTTYNLNNITVATPPSGSQISWHTSSPATNSNKIATPTNVRAGERYFVAFYNSSSNCYGATSEVLIKRYCLITNPMIRQRTK